MAPPTRSHSNRPHSAAQPMTSQAVASAAVARLFTTQQQRKRKEAQNHTSGRPPWQESFASKSAMTEADIGTMRSTQFADSEGTSRFMVQAKKGFHGIAIPAEAKATLQNCAQTPLDHQMEYNKAIHILRHEEGLAKRRVLDGYLNLTGAQLDTHLTLPNQSYAAQQVNSSGSAPGASASWVLNNKYRQQMSKAGVPVMTQVMQGEFYTTPEAPRRTVTNFIASNKIHVTAASHVSSMVPVVPTKHNRRTCYSLTTSQRSASARR